MTENNADEDILLRLTMPGKSLRIDPKDAPQMPAPKPMQQPSPLSQPSSQPLPHPVSAPQQTLQPHVKPQEHFQPQRETNTILPPANTPPPTEEAQEDILKKLTMKPKEYVSATPTVGQVKEIRPPPGYIYQTPEEIRSNKPFVSSDAEVERVKKMAQNIIGSDMVQNRLKKK
ncbi:MAG: hypothetical protein Q8L34_03710 [Candidatus Woesearchaeota archaeon]|nr:hypothetical protein [Candidatus Woesearchaeota archaeon]